MLAQTNRAILHIAMGVSVQERLEPRALHSIFGRQLLQEGMNVCSAPRADCTSSFLHLLRKKRTTHG